MLDVDGQVIEERPDIKPKLPRGDNRTFRLILDPNQYQLDLVSFRKGRKFVWTGLYKLVNMVLSFYFLFSFWISICCPSSG